MNLDDYQFQRSFSDYRKGKLVGYFGNPTDGHFSQINIFHDTETNKWYLASETTGRPSKKEVETPSHIK